MLIAAVVTENEGHAILLATQQMRRLFLNAGARESEIDCRLTDSLQFEDDRQPDICIVSLLREVESDALDRVRARLTDELRKFAGGRTAVYLCTIFRVCDDAAALERIRRLNLLAAELSHDLDIGVIDFDRQFADIGARTLETSYRLEGGGAREIAAYTVVKTLLASGAFEDRIDDATIEQARAAHASTYQANAVAS